MAATNFAWSLAALVFLIRLLTDPASRRFRWTGLEFPWLLFFGATVLSCAFAADPARGFRKLPTELLAIVFVLGAQAQDREDAERNLSVFLLASAYIGLWGLLQYGLGIVKEGGQYIVPEWAAFLPKGMIKELVTARGRAVGHFSHPLTYANVLLLSAPIFLGLALKSWGMARRNAPVAAELRDSHPIPSWSYWTGFFLVFLFCSLFLYGHGWNGDALWPARPQEFFWPLFWAPCSRPDCENAFPSRRFPPIPPFNSASTYGDRRSKHSLKTPPSGPDRETSGSPQTPSPARSKKPSPGAKPTTSSSKWPPNAASSVFRPFSFLFGAFFVCCSLHGGGTRNRWRGGICSPFAIRPFFYLSWLSSSPASPNPGPTTPKS
jgi:hypothetical protein